MEFKVNYQPLSKRIVAGKVTKNYTWSGTLHDITDTAPGAVADMLLQQNIYIEFERNNKKYRLDITEIE